MFYLDPYTQKRYRIGTPFEYNGIAYGTASARMHVHAVGIYPSHCATAS